MFLFNNKSEKNAQELKSMAGKGAALADTLCAQYDNLKAIGQELRDDIDSFNESVSGLAQSHSDFSEIGKFSDTTLFTTNHLAPGTISYPLRAQLLADAIPAESFPAGYMSPLVFSGSLSDYDMATEFKDANRIEVMDANKRRWRHSYFLQAPYMVVHDLFENINQKIQ